MKLFDDMGIAIQLADHITRPCQDISNPDLGINREFYIKEAQTEMQRMRNPYAVAFLQAVIGECSE